MRKIANRWFLCAPCALLFVAGCTAHIDFGPRPEVDAGSGTDHGRCGNGRIEVPEMCDDGNALDSDGCSSQCAVEGGWICAEQGTPCVQSSSCGDGTAQRELGEQCDLGPNNGMPGSGCTADCRLQRVPVCGDGVRDGHEACDDGNVLSGDGCSVGCEIEPTGPCKGDGCKAICGDGIVQVGEECDDGNVDNRDGCSAECKRESGWTCTDKGCATVCGDGVVQGLEQCDDGPKNGTTDGGCSAACTLSACGNGVVERGEECDDGRRNGYSTCTVACRKGSCGDGVLNGSEQCDDGNTTNDDGCSESCTVEASWACSQSGQPCVQSECGNGVVEAFEDCDEGPNNGTGLCSAECKIGQR